MKEKNNSNSILLAIVGVIVITVLAIGAFSVTQSNSINSKYQAVQMQYGQVEAVLQRRYDLLPNLTSAVKGSMKQEQTVFGDIAKARSQYSQAKTPQEKFKADKEINKSTNMLLNVIHEKYPKLESNTQVSNLMVEIEGCENRISTERQNYNAVVNDYNTKITSFPGSMFANGKKPIAYFKADQNAEKAPKVDLD